MRTLLSADQPLVLVLLRLQVERQHGIHMALAAHGAGNIVKKPSTCAAPKTHLPESQCDTNELRPSSTILKACKMAPRKRKTDDQPKLEDVADEPVKVSKSKKGDLAQTKKETKYKQKKEKDDEGDDLFLKRRARITGVEEPAKSPSKEAVHKEEEAAATKPATGSDAGIW